MGDSKSAFVLAITSGKGGVGKTSIALNLSIQLSRQQARVLLVDMNLGLANLGILLNITSNLTLEDVLDGRCDISQAIQEGPEGLRLVPASLSSGRPFAFTPLKQRVLAKHLTKLKEKFDLILLDTPSGFSPGLDWFLSVADEISVVTTPEPTAIADAYAMVKIIYQHSSDGSVSLLLNMVRSKEQAEELKTKFNLLTQRFLNSQVVLRGYVLFDPQVAEAVWKQVPFVVGNTNAPASLCVAQIARRLLKKTPENRSERGLPLISSSKEGLRR